MKQKGFLETYLKMVTRCSYLPMSHIEQTNLAENFEHFVVDFSLGQSSVQFETSLEKINKKKKKIAKKLRK